MRRAASCSCGQLSIIADGEPVKISVCHCRACQRRTAAAVEDTVTRFCLRYRWNFLVVRPRRSASNSSESRDLGFRTSDMLKVELGFNPLAHGKGYLPGFLWRA